MPWNIAPGPLVLSTTINCGPSSPGTLVVEPHSAATEENPQTGAHRQAVGDTLR